MKKYYAAFIVRSSGDSLRLAEFSGESAKTQRDRWVAESPKGAKNLEGKRVAISASIANSKTKFKALELELLKDAL